MHNAMCFDHIHPLLLPLTAARSTLTSSPSQLCVFFFLSSPLIPVYAANMLVGVGSPPERELNNIVVLFPAIIIKIKLIKIK